jgi:hypothetical protein
MLQFAFDEIGKAHALQRGAALEGIVELFRDVTDLDHFHAYMIQNMCSTCNMYGNCRLRRRRNCLRRLLFSAGSALA